MKSLYTLQRHMHNEAKSIVSPSLDSQLVNEGEEFLLKKASLKTHRASGPIKTSPLVAPTKTKEAATGNAPIDALPQAVICHFP